MPFFRSIFTVSSYTILSRLGGFVRELLTASFLGAGAVTDALSLSIRLPAFFRRLFAEGAFNACFVPIFSGLLAAGKKEEAKTFAEHAFTLLLTVLVLLVLLVEIFLPEIVPALLPGFAKTPERMDYLIQFTRVTFPFILFISLTALYGGVLNSLERFAAVASSPLIGNIFIVGFVLGMHTSVSKPGYVFALAIGFSGLAQLLWVMVPAWKIGFFLKLVRPQWTPHLKNFFLKMGPAALGSGISNVNLFLGTFIASWLPVGSIAYLGFADRLNQLPLSVIGVTVSTVLLPMLSKQIRSNQLDQAKTSQLTAIELSLFFSLPSMLCLLLLAKPLVASIFEHGAFKAADTLETSKTLMAYALGLPAYVIAKVLSSRFFAEGDTKIPLLAGACSIVVDLGLSLALMGVWHHVGIAFATSGAAWVDAILLAVILAKRGTLGLTASFGRFFLRLLVACALTAVALQGTQSLLICCLDTPSFSRLIVTFFLVAEGIMLFFVFTKWLSIPLARFYQVPQEV
ncbi:MAG: murein biosynthesis integral membrane protein MurJ [Alphaproteobacteria bacterium]